MRLQVLGTNCARCRTLLQNTNEAAAQLGLNAEIEKIEDISQIMRFGVMTPPALAVDGQVKFAGQVLSVDDIKKLLAN